MFVAGDGNLADRFGRFVRRNAEGSVTRQEWIEFGETGSALFERYQSRGAAADPADLLHAHQIASAGAQCTDVSLKQQFYTLLTAVILVENRRDTDPGRRAAVAAIARQLCHAYEGNADQHSLRRVFEIARLWEECAQSAGATAEAAEARNTADRALGRLKD
jgi:hypothetical protein